MFFAFSSNAITRFDDVPVLPLPLLAGRTVLHASALSAFKALTATRESTQTSAIFAWRAVFQL
jgi:hypothetical protein